MRRAREKRILLCALALVAPLPLPFNEVLAWPLLFLFAALVVACLQRAEREASAWLPNWALNLLGLAYLPVLFFDVRAAYFRGRTVSALVHLLLFVLLVKLWSMRRERDKWVALVVLFFLFLGAMATSAHVTVSLYLLGFGCLFLVILGRFVGWNELDLAGVEKAPEQGRIGWRRARPVAVALVVAVVAVPVFLLVPRLREPLILARGAGAAALARTSGFSDVVDLDQTTSIRGNRNVVLRAEYADERRVPAVPRFKAATYEWYENRRWHRVPTYLGISVPSSDEGFLVGRRDLEARNSARIWQEPISSASLVLPVESLLVRLDGTPQLNRDPGGAVFLPAMPRDTFGFEVTLAEEMGLAGRLEPAGSRDALTALDDGGLTPRIRQLAREVAGDGSADDRIARLERYLLDGYEYSLDLVGWTQTHPIEEFLFEHRSGHCELFASSLVLMLRAEGIPARLATGFLGAEFNPLEDYYIVRQQNAHAWVEAWTERSGWRVFDPTPPEGRPATAQQGLGLLARQVWDWVTFRWDRYVLTYGAADQKDLLAGLREVLERWWRLLSAEDEPEALPVRASGAEAFDPAASGRGDDLGQWDFRVPPVGVVLIVLLVALLLVRAWARGPSSATETWIRARRWASGRGVDARASRPPRELAEAVGRRFPSVAAATTELVGLYLRESFAGERLGVADRRRAGEAFAEMRRLARRELRRERRQRSRWRQLLAPAE